MTTLRFCHIWKHLTKCWNCQSLKPHGIKAKMSTDVLKVSENFRIIHFDRTDEFGGKWLRRCVAPPCTKHVLVEPLLRRWLPVIFMKSETHTHFAWNILWLRLQFLHGNSNKNQKIHRTRFRVGESTVTGSINVLIKEFQLKLIFSLLHSASPQDPIEHFPFLLFVIRVANWHLWSIWFSIECNFQ